MKDIPTRDRIILALDVETTEAARELVLKTESHLGFYKVGLQLFMAGWFETVDWLVDRGHKVMLDLKFFDIPETVKLAVAAIRDRGVSLATIHGNDPIIRAALEEKGSLRLLAVTVLTSFGEDDLRAMGMTQSIEDLVTFRARRALELGCDGVVSSGMEAARLRKELGEKLLIVTPGIRPGANVLDGADDQTRIMTAKRAIAGGADHVVVGRPISRAKDPIAVIAAMQREIEGVTG
ncbi:MAG: orotidine-5'-phosphate decarboxylase [Proteobacteria bacterium]|nr:orotidine-5'-phosphate decarboxylase [Pseudomonadota bacterium]MBU1686057.1 orotidine-5'-phosphate decarboxylase [Pseudomonadota bacterium]